MAVGEQVAAPLALARRRSPAPAPLAAALVLLEAARAPQRAPGHGRAEVVVLDAGAQVAAAIVEAQPAPLATVQVARVVLLAARLCAPKDNENIVRAPPDRSEQLVTRSMASILFVFARARARTS